MNLSHDKGGVVTTLHGCNVILFINLHLEKKIGINGQAIKQEETQLQLQQRDFTKLLTENKLGAVAEQASIQSLFLKFKNHLCIGLKL